MIYNIIPQFFLTFVVKFGVKIPNTLRKSNKSGAWKLENMVTKLNKQ